MDLGKSIAGSLWTGPQGAVIPLLATRWQRRSGQRRGKLKVRGGWATGEALPRFESQRLKDLLTAFSSGRFICLGKYNSEI